MVRWFVGFNGWLVSRLVSLLNKLVGYVGLLVNRMHWFVGCVGKLVALRLLFTLFC